jgi:hypothetical protein
MKIKNKLGNFIQVPGAVAPNGWSEDGWSSEDGWQDDLTQNTRLQN